MSAEDEDMDFFDNLGSRSGSSRRRPAPSAAQAPISADAPSEFDENETPLQQLIRHWMNERHTISILPVQQVLLAGLLDHVRAQVNR